MKSYAGSSCATEHDIQDDVILPCARLSGEQPRRDRKTIPPADFSRAGGNLFNVWSFGLDRDVEGRSSQTRDA